MQKIGEKCGMTKEGVIRKVRFLNNQYYDSVKYSILREELAIRLGSPFGDPESLRNEW